MGSIAEATFGLWFFFHDKQVPYQSKKPLIFPGLFYVKSGKLLPGEGATNSMHWSKTRFDEKFIAVNDVVYVMPAGYSKLPSQLGSILD